MLALLLSCGRAPSTSNLAKLDPDNHAAAVEAWHAERLERLHSEDGWLALVGLAWLEQGRNSFGPGADNDVVLPLRQDADQDRLDTLGSFVLDGDSVFLEMAPATSLLTRDGEAANGILVTDADGDPTILQLESLSFYALRRGERTGIRIRDASSPLLHTFDGIERFPIDTKWALPARFEPAAEGSTLPIPNILGLTSSEVHPGSVHFELNGRSFSLDAMEGNEPGELFLVFGDTTNGEATYGGGRFLYAGPPNDDGLLYVDFNRSYNPPCVFTPWAT